MPKLMVALKGKYAAWADRILHLSLKIQFRIGCKIICKFQRLDPVESSVLGRRRQRPGFYVSQ
jgi:hypothetical protein